MLLDRDIPLELFVGRLDPRGLGEPSLLPGVGLGDLLVAAALGSGVTVQLGDSVDDDRFIAATVCTSAVEAFKGKTDGVGYKATADTPLVLKTGVAAATGKVQLVIFKAVSN